VIADSVQGLRFIVEFLPLGLNRSIQQRSCRVLPDADPRIPGLATLPSGIITRPWLRAWACCHDSIKMLGPVNFPAKAKGRGVG
jgi:hypothetical protein